MSASFKSAPLPPCKYCGQPVHVLPEDDSRAFTIYMGEVWHIACQPENEDPAQILPKEREDELIRAITMRNHDAPYFNLRNILRIAIADGYEKGKAVKQCEGCRRAYPKNEAGQHVWPSGIGGGDFRECSGDDQHG